MRLFLLGFLAIGSHQLVASTKAYLNMTDVIEFNEDGIHCGDVSANDIFEMDVDNNDLVVSVKYGGSEKNISIIQEHNFNERLWSTYPINYIDFVAGFYKTPSDTGYKLRTMPLYLLPGKYRMISLHEKYIKEGAYRQKGFGYMAVWLAQIPVTSLYQSQVDQLQGGIEVQRGTGLIPLRVYTQKFFETEDELTAFKKDNLIFNKKLGNCGFTIEKPL